MIGENLRTSLFAPRRLTKRVRIGSLHIGAHHPIVVQSMTSTDTRNVEATVEEIHRLQDAGCEMVRVAVPDREAASLLGIIKKRIRIPLVADIHFHSPLALLAMEQGVDKIRVNPGNLGGPERFHPILKMARERGIAIRIGVNSGSIEKDILDRFGYPAPEAMVESALRWAGYCAEANFDQVVFSIKSSDVKNMIAANALLSDRCNYPLHLGVTEAGLGHIAIVKSSIGIGTLLALGIGDTLRVSMTGEAVQEIPVAFDILKASGARVISPDIIACPTCGRIAIDLVRVVKEVEQRLKGRRLPIKIAILGCVVNGPGEAREADIGIAGGGGKGLLIKKGELIRTVAEEDMVSALLEEIDKMEKAGEIKGVANSP